MMAAQFYWEKDQGNLELYFTAPMHLMSILAGMAIGGLVMTSSRALAVIVIGSLLYGVTFDVQEPLTLALVFLLTMIPLYGLGMLFASLFLLWGREAFHLAQLLQEPIYFLGGVNFPIRAIGPVAGLVMATLPLGVGLDAMRQLAFASADTEWLLPGRDRDAHPRRHGRRLPRRRQAGARLPRDARPQGRTAHAPMAVTYDSARVRGITLADAWRSFRTAIGLGWAIESNWSDPFLFAVYTAAKPLAGALILVVMFSVIVPQGEDTDILQFMIVGTALWNVVFGVMGGLVQSILEDRERYRMMKYVVVTPSSLFPFLLGRSLARVLISFVAVALTLIVGVVFIGVDLRPNLLILVPATILGVRGRHRARRVHGRLVPPAAPGGVVVPRGDRRRPLSRVGRDLPRRLPARLRPAGVVGAPDDVVDRGLPARAARPRRRRHHRPALGRRGHALAGRNDRHRRAVGAHRVPLVHVPGARGRPARHDDRELRAGQRTCSS